MPPNTVPHRPVRVDLRPVGQRSYDCAGYQGERGFIRLLVTPPKELLGCDCFRLWFSVESRVMPSSLLTLTRGLLSYTLPSLVCNQSETEMQLEGYFGLETAGRSRRVKLKFGDSIQGELISTDTPGVIQEVDANTAARHIHHNKEILDEIDGPLSYQEAMQFLLFGGTQ